MSEANEDVPAVGLPSVDGYARSWFAGFRNGTPGYALDGDAKAFAASLADLVLTVKHQGIADEKRALDVITEGAVALIAGAEFAAVVVPAGPKRLAARSVHGDLPPLVMGMENDLAEGPCIDAVMQTAQVVVPDLQTEVRWPAFSKQVQQLGVGSMLCTPLAAEDKILGSLTLVSTQPNAFDEESAGLAAVFATQAAIALVGAIEVRQLKTMVSSRDLIGQAKGILMERYKVDADQAFAVLVRVSQNQNIKLREICQQLVATGQLPA
jgi:GAF domain-containing protein